MDRNADGSVSLSREELYALVWETPISKLAPTVRVATGFYLTAALVRVH